MPGYGVPGGWGGVIRTHGCGSQSPVPYRLATSQYLVDFPLRLSRHRLLLYARSTITLRHSLLPRCSFQQALSFFVR